MPSTKKIKPFQLVQLERRDSILKIILNRPDALNAFNLELASELGAVLKEASTDDSLRAVVIAGSGKGFSAGGDLKMFHAALPHADRAFKKITGLLNQAVEIIRTMPKPVIAAIHGSAFAAGFGLALASDLVVASENARLSASFINIALCPNASSSLYLPKIIGFRRASECFLTGTVLSAQQALEWGLVNRVFPDDIFEEVVWSYAAELASRPTATIARTKLLLNESIKLGWKRQLQLEKEAIAWSATTEDFAEGVSAFVEKRKPSFKGK